MIKYSIEILYHFNCTLCKKWWSIGDFNLKKNEHLTCPYCGCNQELMKSKKND